MRKVALSLAFSCIAVLTVSAQNDPSPAKPAGTPPVLKGGTRPDDSPPTIKDPNAPPSTTAPAKTKSLNSEDEVLKVDTDLVSTPVSVLDRNGRFIAGLKKTDFRIFENDVPQKVTYFQSEEQPFTVVLMLDVSPSTRYKMDDIHY